MPHIPEFLNQHILEAYPENCCTVSTLLADGYCQIALRGSIHVYNQDTIAYWDRGTGTTAETVQNGSKVTVFYRNGALSGRSGNGLLPAGGTARFYGVAEVHADDDEFRERVWNGMIQAERDGDPEKAGRAVLVKLDRAEQLNGKPLSELDGVPVKR